MKNSILTILIVLWVVVPLRAQQEASQRKSIKSGIIIKSTPLPFLFETAVGGNIEVKQGSLSFTPFPCGQSDNKVSSIFPCNNFLINNINLGFNDISKIKRRNFLLLFPNRVLVKKLSGETYLFTTYRRRVIIDAYNEYKAKNSSLGMK